MVHYSGNIYEGSWVDGNPHGKGKATYIDGRIYEGDWANGKKEGKGK